MTTEQYLHILQQELAALPYDEQKEALDYYRNYFDEAGEKNAQKVMAELGSPQKLGAYIRSNFSCVPARKNNGEKADTCTDEAHSASAHCGYKYEYEYDKNARTPAKHNGANILLIILLLALTFPVWFSVLASLVGIGFGIVVALLAIGCAGIIGAIAVFASGIVVLYTGCTALVGSFFNGLLGIGAGLVLLGIALLFGIFGVWLCKKVLPAIIRAVVYVCALPFRHRR